MFKLTAGAKVSQEPVLREYDAPESFDAYQYLNYLRRRSRFILVVCAVASVLVLVASLLLPKEYTATASILIEPPAADDPRASVAVNPTYLESLRSYELFASGDTLFQRALDKFQLRDRGRTPIESLKRRVLKVTKLRDTKVLQIEVTLPDAVRAQAMAQFLAEETANLNRSANRENDRDLLNGAELQSSEIKARLEREQKAWREFNEREAPAALRAEIETLTSLRRALLQNLADARAELAEFADQAGDARLAGVRARQESLGKQDAELQHQIDDKAALLAKREARGDELLQSLRGAQTASENAMARLSNLRATTGLRGERLRVLDPGVVPERPSSPNVALNVALALAGALAASITYLTLTFRPVGHDRSPES